MDWKDIAAAVGKSAPLLGTVLGGPAGAAIGSLVAAALGSGSTPDDVSAAIAADPQAALKLRELEFAHEAQLQGLTLDTTKAFLADVQDARHMQNAALGQADTFSKRFVYYFAAGWSLFTGAYFIAVTFVPVPVTGQRVADTILGVLISSVLGGIMGYFYGSTKGSADKTALLAKAAPTK